MSKKGFTLIELLIAVALVCIALLVIMPMVGCDVNVEDSAEEVRGDPYLIEYFPSEEAPELVRIKALEGKYSWDNKFYYSEEEFSTYYVWGYGDCFKEALQEVLQKYVIKGFGPINYEMSSGSPTKDLWLVVEPRE